MALVEAVGSRVILADQKPRLCIWAKGDSVRLFVYGKGSREMCRDTAYFEGFWANKYPVLPSSKGTILAPAADFQDTLSQSLEARLSTFLAQKADILRHKSQSLERFAQEMRYYLATHTVEDDGYDAMARRNEALKREKAATDTLLSVLQDVGGKRLTLHTERRYCLLKKSKETGLWQRKALFLSREKWLDGFQTLRLEDKTTPREAKPIYVKNLKLPYLRTKRASVAACLGVKSKLFELRNHCVRSISAPLGSDLRLAIHPLLVPRGKPLFSSRGFFIGVSTGNVIRKTGRQKQGNLLGGYAVETAGGELLYEGFHLCGLRSGRGIVRDSTGRHITGVFLKDSLKTGVRSDKDGIYQGAFNSQTLLAEGYGEWFGWDFSWQKGTFREDRANGFLVAIRSDGKPATGEWLKGKFRGERMLYTQSRIYGIDISRYQHGKGRRKTAIDFSRMRITHLGSLSKKRVQGTVDYPVRFIFIKSTEGTTVRNPYYLKDYLKARRTGLFTGSYHFFSTKKSASLQARYFLRSSRFSTGDLPAVLDVEPSMAQIQKMGGKAALLASVRQWLRIVESATGKRPILYVSQQFVNNILPLAPDLMTRYSVWIARYGEFKPDVRLAFWQLSPDGRVSGIRGDVDVSVFNGNIEELRSLCR